MLRRGKGCFKAVSRNKKPPILGASECLAPPELGAGGPPVDSYSLCSIALFDRFDAHNAQSVDRQVLLGGVLEVLGSDGANPIGVTKRRFEISH